MADEKKEGKLIGRITHFFDNIGVAVIEVSDRLRAGDTIRIVGGGVDFEEKVDSMEMDHQRVSEAKKGNSVGVKVSQRVHEGYRVFKV
ncbi:MAG: hypothetical protein A2Z68_01710 [Candidatus Nealsonbacteria bacterium RBG_13_38_11]|uniref:Translation elongation factor EFTu-like domain-containing protein n=1 Tax=Candidatus Nealsonbacteria bacterium RBG_13_38_11 TaxID=1801662 RepID=A0A1G2E1B4_9BACT|nr:MAG: hypothetical protein A2Z68_01710 [Candidatus Nealsonbacteria bacterium RBG_13_38_11]